MSAAMIQLILYVDHILYVTQRLPVFTCFRLPRLTHMPPLCLQADHSSDSRRHTVEMWSSAAKGHLILLGPWPLTSDLENLFNNGHSNDDHLCQVLLKSVSRMKKYRVTRIRVNGRTDDLHERRPSKFKPHATYTVFWWQMLKCISLWPKCAKTSAK